MRNSTSNCFEEKKVQEFATEIENNYKSFIHPYQRRGRKDRVSETQSVKSK